jgi:hypothetical protein
MSSENTSESAPVHSVVIPLRGQHKSLNGQTLVYRQDPVFGRKGWCIAAGSLVVEMQTMGWVNPLVTKPGSVGQTGIVVGSELRVSR